MLNDILLAFFFGMPAIVAIFLARGLTAPAARAIMFWGGILFTGAVALVLVPMLLCDGHIMQPYTACFGGARLDALFTAAQPLIRMAAFAYIMVGPPLAILAYLLDWMHRRRARRAA